MNIGYQIPIGVENDETGEIEIQLWIVNWISERVARKTRRKDNICSLCGQPIPVGSLCKSANIVIVPSFENKCPREMFPMWWHDGCERLPIETRIETTRKFIAEKQERP